MNAFDTSSHQAWQGFMFEQICMDYIFPIKTALGISGIQSQNHSWRGGVEEKNAQIDLLIDRRNQVINLYESKFSLDAFTIDKVYLENLRLKITIFKVATKTKKSVYLTMITTYGVDKNKYANSLVQSEIVMDNLFYIF